MSNRCFFCALDEMPGDEDDRRMAYYILGHSLPENETERQRDCDVCIGKCPDDPAETSESLVKECRRVHLPLLSNSSITTFR